MRSLEDLGIAPKEFGNVSANGLAIKLNRVLVEHLGEEPVGVAPREILWEFIVAMSSFLTTLRLTAIDSSGMDLPMDVKRNLGSDLIDMNNKLILWALFRDLEDGR